MRADLRSNMQPEPPGEAWPGDAWAFGGVNIQSLQAELAAVQQEKQALLRQAQAALQPCKGQKDVDALSHETHAASAAKDQVLQADLLPQKAPLSLTHNKPKQPPLRSLSWDGSPKSGAKPSQQPPRRSTFNFLDSAAEQHGSTSQKQSRQQTNIQHWLSDEQTSAAASATVNIHCVRQEVLQEVLQAVTLTTNASTSVDYNDLTVQAVAEVAKQQLAHASEAATKEKEAAISKCIQSVQRRASKEALQQADQVVAKAQQAAADAAQRSGEEATRLRRELEALKREKRGLTQRCTSADRDLAAATVSQERLQQQLSQVRAVVKASDTSKAQADVQHQAHLAEVHDQLATAKQHNTDLQAQHQQDLQQQLASAAAAAAELHQHEMQTLRSQYTASCHQQVQAMGQLQQEVAFLTQEAEHDMTNVAQKMSALHEASCSSQAELQQQLQRLRAEVSVLQNDSTGVSNDGSMQGRSELQETLIALMDVCQQLDAVGCAGVGALLQEHQQVKAQAMSSQQEYAELQQQLQEQTERHDREVSDLTRMTSKVQDLEFDLGNMRQSLQVKGEECQVLQGQCDELQHEMDCLQAEHAKHASATVKHHSTLREQAEKHGAAIQHLQQQLQAAVQQLMQLQQQAPVQFAKAYKAAVASSAKCLQELQERYFHSTPVQPLISGKQSNSSSLLKHHRDSIVAAYSDFQQRRDSVESMASAPANAFCSPSSTLHRKTWQRGLQGVSQLPWFQQASLTDGSGRGLNASSRLMDSMRSFADPVSRTSSEQPSQMQREMLDGTVPRTSSAAMQKQELSHQPSQAALGPESSGPQVSAQYAAGSQHLQHDVSLLMPPEALMSSSTLPDMASALDWTAWVLPEVQPDASWLSPFMRQLLQFEGCLLHALTALLTQTPLDRQDEHSVAGKGAVQKAAPRQQCWPKAAQDSQQLSENTTGEMVRAMSSQKRDLSRRLKAAEGSNRQLRSELQELRIGGRSGLDNCSVSAQPHSAVSRSGTEVRGSWQEMAAVLDMLQDISIPSEAFQPSRSFSAMSPATFAQRKPRCNSAISPDSSSRAASRKPRCCSALSPRSALHAASQQAGAMTRQQLSHGPMSPLATSCSRTPSNGKTRASPLSACGNRSHRQEWQ